MKKKLIKEKMPALYELAMYLRLPFMIHKRKKEKEKFYNLSIKEIMKKDALLYKERQGRDLDWRNLKTYTEKMQYAKILDQDKRKVELADKYLVRKYVERTVGKEILIPLVDVKDSFRDIKLSDLPNQFVIKTNHGSGDVVIVKDKNNLNIFQKLHLKRIITLSENTDYSTFFCEMHYGKINPKIIVEQYIDSKQTDLQDYKFLCFDGVPYYCWVDIGRYSKHQRVVYDMEWKRQPWNQYNYEEYHEEIDCPKNFEEMKSIVKKLAVGFSHVRVDLYNVNGKIYFGEMTFTNGSGFEPITPREFDYYLGDLWKLEMKEQ